MIIVENIAPTATPDMLRATFNCKANEATPLFMDIDVVYIYMNKGETRTLDLPASANLAQGAQIPLHEIAEAYTLQHKDFGLAWSQEDLPDLSALRPNPALPYLKL